MPGVRGLGFCGGLCALALGLIVGRVVLDARAHLRAGTAARSAGDVPTAAREWGRAVRMYTPQNPYAQEAAQQLLREAQAAEKSGAPEQAIRCYRELRHAVLGARSFYTPYAELLAQADGRLAVLLAQAEASVPNGNKDSLEERIQRHQKWLARAQGEAPRPGWSALAVVGAVMMIVGAARGFLRAPGTRLLPAALIYLVGFLLMCLGLHLA